MFRACNGWEPRAVLGHFTHVPRNAMRRSLGPVLVLLFLGLGLGLGLGGCDKSEDRVATLEARIAELEKKQGESDKTIASLATLPAEQKVISDKVTALQMSDVETTQSIASLQRDAASVQEKLAILATPGTMSVDPDAKPGGAIGIPECDEYITKYTKCIADKVPEAARESMMDAMDQSKKAWKEAASGPARKQLGEACKAALEAAATATAAMGCEW
jgi:uncharacterized coiled-coil protein SlyX